MRRVLSLLTILMLASQVWAETQSIDFAGSRFEPTVYEIDGRTYYSTDDQEITRLISRTNVTVQWSTSGNTVFAFAPGRETYLTANSERATVNKKEVPAPGRFIVKDGQRYVEPEGLFYALACKGVPSAGGYKVYPVITELAQTENGFLLRAASKANPKQLKGDTATLFTVDGFAWDGPREVTLGESVFTFSGGADKDQPLEITVTAPTFYAAALGGSTLLNETKINIVPNFPGADQTGESTLKQVSCTDSEGNPMLVLEFDRGTKVHYHKKNDTLHLFVPKASLEADVPRSEEWQDLEITTYTTSLYPMVELTFTADAAYEFVDLEDSPMTIALVKGSPSQVNAIAESGTVETRGWTSSVNGTIVLDPGHGGSDSGCVNRTLGTRECDITLKICLHLAEILRAQGWNVVLTRESDRDVTYAGSPDRMELEARADVANKIGADLFMSVHCDASVNSGSRGSSIHWWKPEDYAFAQALEPMLGEAIGLGQKGLIRNRFVVLRHAQMPSVLVETAFLTNPLEGAKLSDPSFQKVVAQQLAGGLASYMQGVFAARPPRRPID